MPPHQFTATSFRRNGFPRQSFTHEHILQVCEYYENLLKHLEAVQARINEAIDKFQHTQHGRPSEPLAQLISDLATIDAGVQLPLMQEIFEVKRTADRWRDKSARLRSEAKRQRAIRARKHGGGAGADYSAESEYAYDEPADGGDLVDPTAPPGDFLPSAPPELSPTMARALRGMGELPAIEPGEAPDTSNYRKSGLI